MSLPVSQYEALLAEVRGLRRKAQRVQQLARPLIGEDLHVQHFPVVAGERRSSSSGFSPVPDTFRVQNKSINEPLDYTMESLLLDRQLNRSNSPNYERAVSARDGSSEDEYCAEARSSSSTHLSVSSEPAVRSNRQPPLESMYHGTWPVERTLWNSEPASIGIAQKQHERQENSIGNQIEVTSVMSFASSSGGVPLDRVLGSPDKSKWSSQQLEAKMDVVHSLLSMLGNQEHVDMGETLLALSTCPESCLAMRQSGCIPLLVQLVQSDKDSDNRKKASQALHNLVNSQPDEKIRKRECRVLKLLEHTRLYTEALKTNSEFELDGSSSTLDSGDQHPVQTIAHIMKLSFDEGHRQAICQLGGIHIIAGLVEAEHMMHGSNSTESHCILMRRYACMALTNLTFGDSGNKALLCSLREFMRALVIQLQSPSDELRQVTASVLRNLSWRADSSSKEILREVGSVMGLMKAAMLDNKENTLKSILSALWNLSAHCTENKSEICAVEGALGFIVTMLTYKTPSKSLAIIENSGGILRNISSQIAVREDYREILRQHNCLQVLLDQLKSPSLTIVSNACGTLWNLSAKCATDQEALWQMGAPAMLRSLNHSKHKMIAMGSSAALKNLLSARPQQALVAQLDATAFSLNLPALPTLGARKQKALLQDLDNSLTETYENIEKDSPVKTLKTETGVDISDFIQDTNRTKSTRAQSPLSPQFDINSAFSSLSLNEPSTSYSSDLRHKPRIPQNYGSSSLPYMSSPVKRTSPCAYIPVKSDLSDCDYDDQPIDYSRKYVETTKKESENFGIYAETDLDQPTDYSLRYAEDNSDPETSRKNSKQEYVQDTVKTYCTEGTPYETPFIMSTATSMSDLRNVEEKQLIDNDIQKDTSQKIKETRSVDEKDHCSTEDISELDNQVTKPNKSEFSSGLMSPEKPVNYCEEGTPGYFSRVSSFGSLNSIPQTTLLENEEKGNESKECVVTEKEERKSIEKGATGRVQTETKAVKFEQVVNYAEETPLMFSRSSSLASLDSIEQHSIHDDRSSVVSDFSRLTSGIVSPSELPDSPTQTVPPSPRPGKNPMEFPSSSKHDNPIENKTHSNARTVPKPSIFEDNLTKFKEESTPIQFSMATSLSSLTIDDHEENETGSPKTPDTKVVQKRPNVSPVVNNVSDTSIGHKEEQEEKTDKEKETSGSDLNDDEFGQDTEDEGDDDDILAACISDGMQNNRHNQNIPTATSTPSKLPLSSFKYQKPQGSTNIPMVRRSPLPVETNSSVPLDISPRTFCTEDTPAELSRQGSNSNLSAQSNENKNNLSDDSSNLSGDNDNILAECIQSAMPKAKKDVNKQANKPISCLPRRHVQPIKDGSGGESNVRQGREARKMHQQQSISSNKRDNSLPPYLMSKDEFRNYAEENSPSQFSLRSSLSDLTVDGSVAGLKKSERNQLQGANNIRSDGASGSGDNPTAILNISQENNSTELTRRESLSSISIESLGSVETEQALLEQCIYSGMPTNKAEEALLEECISAGMPKSSSSSSTNISRPLESTNLRQPSVGVKQYQHSDTHEPDTKSELADGRRSKNGNVASVAGNTSVVATLLHNEMRPDMSTEVTDVERDRKSGPKGTGIGSPAGNREAERTGTLDNNGTLPDSCLHSEENLLTGLTKSGSKKSLEKFLESSFDTELSYSNSDNCANLDGVLGKSCEESAKIVDNRMLDPDAMIESLERFTAELVSQASHLTKDDDKYKLSTNDNTWNDTISPNELTFPSISGSAPNVVTFSDKEASDEIDGIKDEERPSNDFSSINTSTLTESTLIAIEASKIATVFQKEAEMSHSIISAISLDLDSVRPPSQLNSLTNSAVFNDKSAPKSPKLTTRKKSLPAGLLAKRVLTNSLNLCSSLESLEGHSLTNLENVHPPSDIQHVFDMESSMTSIASLPNENGEVKIDFMINGVTNKNAQEINQHNPIFNIKQQYITSSLSSLIVDLDNVNPPSIFNEITDMCNSLADVPTEAICSETDIFEDCYTHVADSTLQDEFSDAASITPIQSDVSSTETTPKKAKTISKAMTTKQRRNLARDRYKTYTVAAEMIMREEEDKLREPDSTSENYQTIQDQNEPTTYLSPTYSKPSPKLTPKEKRQADRSRYETQVLDEAITNVLQRPVIAPLKCDSEESEPNSANPSPTRTKLSIRRSFMQKRLENQDRFKTQTLSESRFSPSPDLLSSASPPVDDLHMLVQKEANLVLKTLRDTKTIAHDEFLDCETLSLVSNDDDSEHNSGSSINYRTYHKSWGIRHNNVPVITSETNGHVNCQVNLTNDHSGSEVEEIEPKAKPKITKPYEKPEESETPVVEEQVKGIRGRRKPLYSKSSPNNKIATRSIKPAKNMTSNLVKNVTSTIKSGTTLKNVINRQIKAPTTTAKPPISQVKSSGYGYKPPPVAPKNKNITKQSTPPQLERQGTFTKDEPSPSGSPKASTKIPMPPSKLPSFTSKIARAVTSKLPSNNNLSRTSATRSGTKSASSDRANKNVPQRIYNRSTSADSREPLRRIQPSPSTHSLKNEMKPENGTVRRSAIPSPAQRSDSNASITSNGSTKKQVTSKIASLWRRVEESKNKQHINKRDTRVWIQKEEVEPPRLIRSNTFDNEDGVVLRNKKSDSTDSAKRVSRLGSFIVMDEGDDSIRAQPSISASAAQE